MNIGFLFSRRLKQAKDIGLISQRFTLQIYCTKYNFIGIKVE